MNQDGPKKVDEVKKLFDYAFNNVKVFETPQGQFYASVSVFQHKEIHPLRSRAFRQWLQKNFYHDEEILVKRATLDTVVEMLEVQTRFSGQRKEEVYVRVAPGKDCVWLDLGDSTRRAIKIAKDGFWLTSKPPVNFLRPGTMQPLPFPQPGATLKDLRSFLALTEDEEEQFALCMGWLSMCLHPTGPYPILALCGGQGSGKTSLMHRLRAIIDPAVPPHIGMPRDLDSLLVKAARSYIMAFDNLSYCPDWLSDALCGLSTGSGFSKRELYTDEGEVTFNVKRPVILNGIVELAVRGDLLERCYVVRLPSPLKVPRVDERP